MPAGPHAHKLNAMRTPPRHAYAAHSPDQRQGPCHCEYGAEQSVWQVLDHGLRWRCLVWGGCPSAARGRARRCSPPTAGRHAWSPRSKQRVVCCHPRAVVGRCVTEGARSGKGWLAGAALRVSTNAQTFASAGQQHRGCRGCVGSRVGGRRLACRHGVPASPQLPSQQRKNADIGHTILT